MSGEGVSKRHPIFTADAWGFRASQEKPDTMNKSPSRLFYVYLMAPAIALLAAITIYPFLWLIYMSLHKVKLGPVRTNGSVLKIMRGCFPTQNILMAGFFLQNTPHYV